MKIFDIVRVILNNLNSEEDIEQSSINALRFNLQLLILYITEAEKTNNESKKRILIKNSLKEHFGLEDDQLLESNKIFKAITKEDQESLLILASTERKAIALFNRHFNKDTLYSIEELKHKEFIIKL